MKCPQCGAAIKRGDGRFCSHCGTVLPDAPRITPDEWRTHPERFAEAEADPAHAGALATPAPAPRLATTVVFPAVFLVFWLIIGTVITIGFADGGGIMALFPLLLVGGGTVMIVTMIARGVRKARAPVERAIAVVLGSRTEISTSGTGDDRRTNTSYYATLQFAHGARQELPTDGALVGVLAEGDIGLAVMRGGDLIDFHRYRV